TKCDRSVRFLGVVSAYNLPCEIISHQLCLSYYRLTREENHDRNESGASLRQSRRFRSMSFFLPIISIATWITLWISRLCVTWSKRRDRLFINPVVFLHLVAQL